MSSTLKSLLKRTAKDVQKKVAPHSRATKKQLDECANAFFQGITITEAQP